VHNDDFESADGGRRPANHGEGRPGSGEEPKGGSATEENIARRQGEREIERERESERERGSRRE